MLFKWNYKLPTADEKKAAKELGEKLNISPILAFLLIRRGISTESGAKRFFHPQLADLNNPFLMKDMDVAVDRLNDAMGRKERILIYGDYDVDGCTAVALVYRFLQQFYSNIEYYIPNRYEEGYGVSKKGIDYANENGIKLIIILDCGIKAIEEVAYAKSLGIDFIICDHHVPDETLPPAVAVLNPKRSDDSYPFKHLCGCGVGFKFMQAFAKNNGIPFSRLIPLLDLCAVSIAADIVPVVDENRILAFHGLKILNQNPSIGLKAIIDICALSGREIAMSDIIFKIGPRINASGRMDNGKESGPAGGARPQPCLENSQAYRLLQRAAQGHRQADDRGGQPDRVTSGEPEASHLHRALRLELEEGRHRHRGLASHRDLFPSHGGAHTRGQHRDRFGTKRHRVRHLFGHQELPRHAHQLRRPHLRCRTDAPLG